MIDVARRAVNGSRNVTLTVADAMHYEADDPYDLVVCSSTLQWLQPYDHFFAQLQRLTTASSWFCTSTMLAGTLGELHDLRRELVPHKPANQSLPKEQELIAFLEQCGFQLHDQELREWTEQHDTAHDFFSAIRSQGFTGGPLSQGRLPLTRGELNLLLAAYDHRHQTEAGKLKATYRYGYFLARRTNAMHR